MKRGVPFYKLVFGILFLLSLVTGCSTFHPPSGKNLQQSAFVWMNQTARVDVIEAKSTKDRLFLALRTFLKESDQHRIFYAQAIWGGSSRDTPRLDKNIVLPLEFIEDNLYQNLSTPGLPVTILDAQHWINFNIYLLTAISPAGVNQGAVVRNDLLEHVVYKDDQSKLQVVEIKDKPKEVTIQKTFTQEEFSELVIESLTRYLDSIDMKRNRILMVMDHRFDDNQALLYVDVENTLAVSLKMVQPKGPSRRRTPVRGGVKSADQIIVDGHIIGMVTRPFSSAFRLYSWAKFSALHSIKPKRMVAPIIPDGPVPPVKDGDPMDIDLFEQELDKMFGQNQSSGQIEFLVGGDAFFPRLIESFQNAQQTIDLRTFIFDNDDYAVKIADILKAKSKEGVRVKVLVDGIGMIMGEGKSSPALPAGFNPPPSMVKYLKKKSNVNVRVRPNAWFKADHTKTIIIDEEICYTGGMNIGREYRYDWHDMMMAVRGPIVREILREFDIAWGHASQLGDISYLVKRIKYRKIKQADRGIPIRPLYTRANDPQIFKAQLAAIRMAKKYIYISNAYFSDKNIIDELIRARRRGVDVRIILPVNGNHEIMNKNNIITANQMFNNGIKVYFYPGMSHIKAAVYDGWLCTGSANFDKLSFIDNLEFNMATSDPATVNRFIEQLFEPDFKKSLLMSELLESGLKDHIAKFLAGQL